MAMAKKAAPQIFGPPAFWVGNVGGRRALCTVAPEGTNQNFWGQNQEGLTTVSPGPVLRWELEMFNKVWFFP